MQIFCFMSLQLLRDHCFLQRPKNCGSSHHTQFHIHSRTLARQVAIYLPFSDSLRYVMIASIYPSPSLSLCIQGISASLHYSEYEFFLHPFYLRLLRCLRTLSKVFPSSYLKALIFPLFFWEYIVLHSQPYMKSDVT